MRILVYEFASGGGLAGRSVAASLVREGAAMRTALVADLMALGTHEIVTTADGRAREDLPAGVEVVTLPDGDAKRHALLDSVIARVDAVWLIAPETDRCLERLAAQVERAGKTLLGAGADAIGDVSNKSQLPRRLGGAGVHHPKTRSVDAFDSVDAVAGELGYPIVVKPARGAGSGGICMAHEPRELRRAVEAARRVAGGGGVLFQEYVRGAAASVSLVADGRDAVPLAVNAQTLAVPPSFEYCGGQTPLEHPLAAQAAAAAVAACRAIPGLRGFVGVDVVLTNVDVVVIEVNARLTTAYLGVRQAIDANVAALALAACAGDLPVEPPRIRRHVRFTASGSVVVLDGAGQSHARGQPSSTSAIAGDTVLGWDVGGANIKVARVGPEPREVAVVEHPCPLWREFNRLPSVLTALAAEIGIPVDAGRVPDGAWRNTANPPVMAVTMTAELADCFATKRDGVAFVIGAFERAFPAAALWIYGVDGRFRSAADARREPHEVAAANWMATATCLSRVHPDALLIDVGSTTTDIIPIAGGRVAAIGRSDPARLASGELVYTGCLRTPLCAVIRDAPLGGGRCRIAAEHFAIAADAYRWLGRIGDAGYTCETPDGRGRTAAEAGARLARMVCADTDTLAAADITAMATHVARTQLRQIAHAIRQVIRRLGPAAPRTAVVAGAGSFLARDAAEAAGLAIHDLRDELGADAARAAPAAAVARLLFELTCSGAM